MHLAQTLSVRGGVACGMSALSEGLLVTMQAPEDQLRSRPCHGPSLLSAATSHGPAEAEPARTIVVGPPGT